MRLPLVEEEIYVSGSGTSGSQRTDLADSAAKVMLLNKYMYIG